MTSRQERQDQKDQKENDALLEKKILFKDYLKESGVTDALAKALVRLYEEPNKPEEGVNFIRKHMCDTCIDDETYYKLKTKYNELIRLISSKEEEIENYKGNIKRTNSEILSLLLEGFVEFDDNVTCTSLLKQHLTKDLFDELTEQKTSRDVTLLDIIQGGFKCNPMDPIGAYAADKRSFDTFRLLLEPIILNYHNNKKFQELIELGNFDSLNVLQPDHDWGSPSAFLAQQQVLDPTMDHVKTVRLEVVRNLHGYPYFQKLTKAQFNEIEDMIKAICSDLNHMQKRYQGTYQSVRELDPLTIITMHEKDVIFKNLDPSYLEPAGVFRFWPNGRGIYTNKDESIIIWVNYIDHLRIISIGHGDLVGAYKYLLPVIKYFDENLIFQRHNRYGNISPNLASVGTGLSVTVNIALPYLFREENNEVLYAELADANVICSQKKDCLSIMNKCQIGLSENAIMQDMQSLVERLLEKEQEVEQVSKLRAATSKVFMRL